jgi:hypothetical protein
MGDEPKFPSPDEAKRKNAELVTPSEPKAAIVVQRAEPVPESAAGAKPGTPKLTPEEVRALLAVGEVNRPKEARLRRGKRIAVPTIVLTIASHFITEYWPIVAGLAIVGALVWTFGPWEKRDDWS